jgi:hypothetical protein
LQLASLSKYQVEGKMSQHMSWDHPLFLKSSPSKSDGAAAAGASSGSITEDDEKSILSSVSATLSTDLARQESSASIVSANSSTNTTGGLRQGSTKTKVALASKNAREKRKKEFELLMEENTRLREERERFLQHIEMLQQKVIEMREKEGDIDLQLENDLLKAQLYEHSMFVNGLMRMASGVPTTEAQKKQLYRQGADYAVAHINSLLSRSVRMHGEWREAKIPEGELPNHMAVWYQHVTDTGTGSRRLNLRADHIIPMVSAEIVSTLYWSLWTNDQQVRSLFDGSKVDAAEISNKVILHDELCLTPSGTSASAGTSSAVDDTATADKEESLATLYTRDDKAHHVFIASKREQSIPRGTLALAMPGDDVKGEMIQPWKRRRCKMCARSNTNINRLQEEGSDAAKAPSNFPKLDSASSLTNPTYVEGSVAWDLDDGRGCRIASVVSLVEGFKVGKFDAFELITMDGRVSDEFIGFINTFVNMLRTQFSAGLLLPNANLQNMALAKSPSLPVDSESTSTGSGMKKRVSADFNETEKVASSSSSATAKRTKN